MLAPVVVSSKIGNSGWLTTQRLARNSATTGLLRNGWMIVSSSAPVRRHLHDQRDIALTRGTLP